MYCWVQQWKFAKVVDSTCTASLQINFLVCKQVCSTVCMSACKCALLMCNLSPTKQEVYLFARTPAFVCLSVCVQDYSKTRAWIWMKFCVSTDVGTWTNWLTFEPDQDHSPDAGTGLLSPIAYALQRGILLRRENPYRAPIAAATCCFESYALQRGILLRRRRENPT